MWSIWLCVTWLGDIHMALWMRLCGKMLPPITSWIRAQTTFVHLSQPMRPHDVLVAFVIHSDLGVEICHQYGYVFCSSSAYCCLSLLVEVIFLLFLRIICGIIELDDVQPNVFLLGGNLGCDDAGVDRFPTDECAMCLQCQHQGHTLSMGGSILDVF